MLHGATLDRVKQISQRELRNDNAEIMRGVEAGETYVVTRRGVPVARIVPISEPDLKIDRPATTRRRFSDIKRVQPSEPTSVTIDYLRGDR
ncbi:MAG: type toxin-antitoxin system prevent-host-death family antitoxin [Marmoricola sp.]|nr:type toxin-antitoxin system prevent-host-death family antitoxin [Marmoricola sp.]